MKGKLSEDTLRFISSPFNFLYKHGILVEIIKIQLHNIEKMECYKNNPHHFTRDAEAFILCLLTITDGGLTLHKILGLEFPQFTSETEKSNFIPKRGGGESGKATDNNLYKHPPPLQKR